MLLFYIRTTYLYFGTTAPPYLVGSIIIYKICIEIGYTICGDSINIIILRIKQYITSRKIVLIFMYTVVFNNESHTFY